MENENTKPRKAQSPLPELWATENTASGRAPQNTWGIPHPLEKAPMRAEIGFLWLKVFVVVLAMAGILCLVITNP